MRWVADNPRAENTHELDVALIQSALDSIKKREKERLDDAKN